MADSHSTLQAYISKILDLKDGLSDNQVLSPEDLKKAALDMGLTDQQWDQLMDEFEDHLTRGIGHAKFKNWDDSIAELNLALEINPFSLKVLSHLAKSHQQKWYYTNNLEDKNKAIAFAEKCLKIEPNNEDSLALISQLKLGKNPNSASGAERRSSSLVTFGAIALLLILGIMFFTFMKDEPNNTEENTTTSESFLPQNPNLGLPVVFTENQKSQNLSFTPEVSETKGYDSSYVYKFRGYLAVDKLEVSELDLTFDFLNNDGDVILTKTEPVLRTHDPTHYNGDLIAIGFDNFEKNSLPRDLSKIQISVNRIIASPGVEISQEYPEVEVLWNDTKPLNIDFTVKERLQKITDSMIGSTFYKFDWELINTGKVSIKSLKIDIVWYGKDDLEIERKSTFFVSGGEPTVKINETRLTGGTYSIGNIPREKIKKYRLFVNSIDY